MLLYALEPENHQKFQSKFDRPAVSLPNLIDENDKTEDREKLKKRRASDSNTTATSTMKSSRSGSRDETPLVREPAYEDSTGLRKSLINNTQDFFHEKIILNRKGTFGSLGSEFTPDSLDSEMTLQASKSTSINKHSKPI